MKDAISLNGFLNRLFGAEDWQTRWESGHWSEIHGWSLIISDLLIGTAYIIIPCLIVYYISRKRGRISFLNIFWIFMAFIFACGIEYLLEICLFWWPVFGLRMMVKILTAVLSWGAVLAVIKNLPIAFAEPTTEELEAEVRQRIAVEQLLAKKAFDLEQTNDDLKTFTYAASHDLQEPLRKIRSFADRLKQKHGEGLDDSGREYLEKINSASIRMQQLIDDLSQYSQIVRSVDETEKVDLNNIIRDVISDLEIVIQEKKAVITIHEMPVIEGIPTQLRQMFQNLFSNALKFTREGIPPQVVISARPASTGVWFISIKDNGIGFDKKYSDKIFIMFQRLHGRSEYDGTGIGLALVKKIIERHHGAIEAHSIPGEGTEFILTLPTRQI